MMTGMNPKFVICTLEVFTYAFDIRKGIITLFDYMKKKKLNKNNLFTIEQFLKFRSYLRATTPVTYQTKTT